VIRDAGPEITNGLGAFLYAARSKDGFGRTSFSWVRPLRLFASRFPQKDIPQPLTYAEERW
jgi:hypothetical protein